jgi:hypothetical protein
VLQAAEVGLGPGGLARHLINMALFAAGQDPLLPPPAPPAIDSSAQWAQFTGANDTLQEIAKQLADTNEKIREALETDHTRVRKRQTLAKGLGTAVVARLTCGPCAAAPHDK